MNLVTRISAFLTICFASAIPLPAQDLLNRLENRLNQLLTPMNPPVGSPEAARFTGPAGYLGLKVEDDAATNSLLVRSIVAGSPAEQAGFRLGDEIVAMNDRSVRNMEELASLLERTPAGARADFDIRREGRRQRVSAVLAPRENVLPAPSPNRTLPEESRLNPQVAVPPSNLPLRISDRPSLGITVVDITDEAHQKFGLAVRRGALMTAIRQGGAADRAGLPIGGVVVAFDGRRIDSSEDLIEAVKASRVGEEVELTYYSGQNLFRKKLRLAPQTEIITDPFARRDPAIDPPLVMKPNNTPAAGSLERLENSLNPPVNGPVEVAKPVASDDLVTLRRQVESMARTIEDLQRRIATLEGRPTPPPPPVPAQENN